MINEIKLISSSKEQITQLLDNVSLENLQKILYYSKSFIDKKKYSVALRYKAEIIATLSNLLKMISIDLILTLSLPLQQKLENYIKF